MPARPISLDVIQIKQPCSADWDAMPGDAARRYCGDCRLHVHDLSAMRRRDAERLIAEAGRQRVCALVRRDDDGRVLTREGVRRQRRRAARARLATVLGLAALTVASGFAAAMGARPDGWQAERQRLIETLRPPATARGGAAERLAGGLTPPVPGEIAAPEMVGDIVMGEPEAVPAPAAVRGRIVVEPR